MKKVVVILSLLITGIQAFAKEKIEIPPKASVERSYAEFENYDVKLINRSGKQIDISVIHPDSGRQVSGFGLAPRGNTTLYVAPGHILKLKNTSSRELTILLDFVERSPLVKSGSDKKTIPFTLRNSSLKSIPLIIPGVMNPNLSPMSNSGVALEIGQEIYYKKGLKPILLLKVDAAIMPGDKIDVAKRIRKLGEE